MKTGAEQAEEDGEGVDEFVTFIRYFLLAFGGIALFVGAFVIFNTLSITVAQRTKELATLRTLGASRRQVLRSVVLEGFVLGVVASAVGLALGVLLAKGLTALFARRRPRDAAGRHGLPDADGGRRDADGHARHARRVGLAGGARDADRADLGRARGRHGREEAVAARRSSSALVVTALSVVGLVYGTLGEGVATARVLGIGLGALGLFIGLAAIAPRLVRPLAHLVGLPAARLGGAPAGSRRRTRSATRAGPPRPRRR